jgi:DNA modification methylase|tara:strand:- start:352 stop:1335 length:984 start_codon:yes stop_codon:yes gene_type:complete
MNEVKILTGECRKSLQTLEPQSINTCVTSPPYWGLRDYGTGTWEGGDPDCPHMRLTKISKDTSTGHRGMYDQGSVVGDAIYKSSCPQCGATRKDEQLGLEDTPEEYAENLVSVFREVRRVLRDDGTVWLNLGDSYSGSGKGPPGNLNKDYHHLEHAHSKIVPDGLKPKDLVGIPWRVAFALQADGWYLRQDIIWHKPNPMPESVKDRCTKAHEYIFLLSKNKNYHFDPKGIEERVNHDTRNKRTVWTVNVDSYREAHFATYPPELIRPCIMAGCPEGGTVLDPFAGSGTTGMVASHNDRNAVLCEINPEYVEIIRKRMDSDMFIALV